jgi:hypothetical protein
MDGTMIFSNDSVAWDSRLPSGTVAGDAPRPAYLPERQRFFVECRVCSFEPASQEGLPGHACPKCFSHSWHRVVRPGAMVDRDPFATSTARLRRLSMARRV